MSATPPPPHTAQQASLANNSPAVSAEEELTRLIFGFMVSRSIALAARLGIADLLQDGPKSADELAVATRTHERSLYRLLRALAGAGVFSEEAGRRFALTPMGKLLGRNASGGIGAFAEIFGTEWLWPVWGELDYSVHTGKSAFELKHGTSFFNYLQENPPAGRIFHEGMTSFTSVFCDAVVRSYDFSGMRTLADVGGGHGYFLASILKHYPSMRGVLFDLASVVKDAPPVLQAQGVADRVAIMAGDFFAAARLNADAVIMKHIIHALADDQALAVLCNCRDTLPVGGKLLLVEMAVPQPNQPSIGKLLDLQMLAFMNSYERTEREYADLLERAGLTVGGVYPTKSPLSIIESRRD